MKLLPMPVTTRGAEEDAAVGVYAEREAGVRRSAIVGEAKGERNPAFDVVDLAKRDLDVPVRPDDQCFAVGRDVGDAVRSGGRGIVLEAGPETGKQAVEGFHQ